MVTFKAFEVSPLIQCKLMIPEVSQAPALFDSIEADHDDLDRWLPWVARMKCVDDEAAYLLKRRQLMIDGTIFMMTIVVNNQPVGMIDLHEIDVDRHQAEVGYWLARRVRNHGIIAKSLAVIVDAGFKTLKLHRIEIHADTRNLASIAVAERAGFNREAVVQDDQWSDRENVQKYIYALTK